MDFEMRLSDDGLDDLAVTSEELMEASAAVSGLVESVVDHAQHKEQYQEQHKQEVMTTRTTMTTSFTSTTAKVVMTATEAAIAGDEETDDEVVRDLDDHEPQTQMVVHDEDQEDGEVNEGDDGDVEMDDFACTQVVVDDDEEEDKEPVEEEAEAKMEDVAVESVEKVGVMEEVAPTTKPATPKIAAPSPRAQAIASPKKPSPVKPAPVAEPEKKKQRPQESKHESDATPLGKFTKVLGAVWDILEHQGWQVAQGKDTLFCAMPGTQFFNFRPNINVFDSKDKACWKFIATSADVKDDKDDKAEASDGGNDGSTKLWEILWAVAEKNFGWYTMACGPETWFVKPDTRFEEFQPNETIFQTKKRAVLKCLELEKVQVELGDSIEGHQMIDFSSKVVVPKKQKEENETPAKKESSHQATPVSKASSGAVASSVKTPSPAVKRKEKKASGSASASSTPQASTSVPVSASKGRSGGASARSTPPKSATKTPLKSGKKVSGRATPSSSKKLGSTAKKKGKKKAAPVSPSVREPTHLAFYIPEFKCTFGIVYKKLQDMGWHHRAGKFEYDYFSPEYTAETAILNGNYFQSAAEFEEYLKDSGLWHKIETELREEHAETVEQLRVEARKRLHKQQERKKQLEALKKQRQVDESAKAKEKAQDAAQEALEAKEKAQEAKQEAKLAKEKAAYERAEAKAAKEEQRRKAAAAIAAAAAASDSAARRKSSFANDFLSEFKVSMGKVVKKLVQRGWSYRPGRFEYDYFKPGVTQSQMKDAILNEDYFQSVAELETYLKISGLWDEIARELRDEHYAEQEREVMLMSQEEEDAKRAVTSAAAPKRKSPTAAAAAAAASPKKARVAVKEDLSVTTTSSSSMVSSTVASLSSAVSSSTSTKAKFAAEEVEELTNDIWANSHHFEFER